MLIYNAAKTPPELVAMLHTLAARYPIREAGPRQKENMVFSALPAGKNARLEVSCAGRTCHIAANTLHCAARGIGSALARLECREKSPFATLGIMLDCSRNKVMKVAKVKEWLDKLCLAGYNLVMLYTEDTYALDEPFFNFMRGGYTLDELREMDDYAATLGIELVGCIQTLGHLEQILRWKAFTPVKDTERVLLAENDATYALVEKMIAFWSKALRSRRINLGMDETWDLGRGRYMNLHGYKNPAVLFNGHLERVNSICRKNGLTPMIWSDMFFRLSNPNHDYYDLSRPVPEAVKKTIPKNVQLCYWDYYHEDEKTYCDMIAAHRALGFEPVLVSGVWTWAKSWCDLAKTEAAGVPCVKASYRTKLKELIFTMWGDDGAYCIFDSAMPGLFRMADLAFGSDNSAALRKRFRTLCGISYDAYCIPAALEKRIERPDGKCFDVPSPTAFVWDDPITALEYFFCSRGWNPLADIRKNYVATLKKIRAAVEKTDHADLRCIAALADAALDKIDLRSAMEKAYAARNRRAAKRIAEELLPEVVEKIEIWAALHRENWLSSAKPAGLDVIQRRTGAVLARLAETKKALLEYNAGQDEALADLGAKKPDLAEPQGLYWFRDYAETSRQG